MKPRTVLLFGWLSALLWSLAEWFHYRSVLGLDERLVRPFGDGWALFGLLWARDLWLLALPTLLGCLLALQGRRRLAAFVALSSWLAVIGYLGLDLACQRLIGSHIMPFLWFGIDVLNSPPGEGMKFAGGTAAIAVPVVLTVLGMLSLAAAFAGASALVARYLRPRLVLLLYPLSLALGFLLPLFFSDPYLISWSFLHLPTRHPELRWAMTSAWSLVHPRSVAVVSVMPRASEGQQPGVGVRNLSSTPLDLNGWSLRSQSGATLELAGELPVGDTRQFPLTVSEASDVISLLQGSRLVDRVQYVAQQVQTGVPISFLDPRLLSPFLRALQDRVKPDFDRLGEALSRPPQLVTRLRAPKKPVHVILLLVESWRYNSVNPEVTPLLWKWMQKGLVLEQHYSGSNTSHLGMYSVLYARNPLLYKRDLSYREAPLFNQIFRAAGYDCRMMAGSAFSGWKWLERFLSTPTFDEKWVNPPDKTNWEYWIESDREMIGSLPERLRQAEKPQFIFCFPQGTHFPYAYPPEFELRKPALAKVGIQDFASATPEMIRNRYQNSVSYLEWEMDEMFSRLDWSNTVVIVTGDHGEAIWEDGTLAHGTRASEIQCRVPCFILGHGISPGVIKTATCHMDLLPTVMHAVEGRNVALPESQGRDLLAGGLQDEVLLAPLRSVPPYQMVLVKDGLKLQLDVHQERLPRTRPDLGPDPGGAHVEVIGFLDYTGEVQWGWSPPDGRLDSWVEALQREFRRLEGRGPLDAGR